MHSKGNHKQNEKTTYGLGENICKQRDQQGKLHQTKKLYTAKETTNRMKRQFMEWDKIFPNHIHDKGLNLQNIQTAHASQYQKKQTNGKMGRRSK